MNRRWLAIAGQACLGLTVLGIFLTAWRPWERPARTPTWADVAGRVRELTMEFGNPRPERVYLVGFPARGDAPIEGLTPVPVEVLSEAPNGYCLGSPPPLIVLRGESFDRARTAGYRFNAYEDFDFDGRRWTIAVPIDYLCCR